LARKSYLCPGGPAGSMFTIVSQLLACLGRLALNTGHGDSNPSTGKCVIKVIVNQCSSVLFVLRSVASRLTNADNPG